MPLFSRRVRARGTRWWAVVLLLIAALPFAGIQTGAAGSVFTATTVGDLTADINAANASPAQGPYRINLVSGTTYILTTEAATGSGTGLPALASGVDLTIAGNGATIQRSGTTATLRLLLINTNGTLRLTGLTLRNGQVLGALGSSGSNGTGNAGGPGAAARGGAIYNNGALIVTGSTFVGNSATGGAGGNGGSGVSGGTIGGVGGNGGAGGDAAGGAIYNNGTLTVTNSTFVGNSATGGAGGSGGSAGTGTSGNGVDGYGANGGSGQGGAIATVASVLQPIANSTITAGSAIGGIGGTGRNGVAGTGVGAGGGVFNGGSGLSLKDTILAGNSATTNGNCTGNFPIDGGYNLEFNPVGTCLFTDHPQTTDPVIGALANHGGPTQTMALGLGSAAINNGNPTVCAGPAGGVDQRGLPRPGGQCSIGAFEPQSAPFPTISGLSPSSGSTAGGSSITLTGTGFVGGATVVFGTVAATATVVTSGTTIRVTVPAHAAATVDITVTNTDMQAATVSLAYTFGTVLPLPPPQPTVSPPLSPPGRLPSVPRPTGVPTGGGPPQPLPPPR